MIDDLLHFLKTPNWRQQHGWRRGIWQTMNRLGLTGLHLLPMSRRWVDIQRRKMPYAGLDPGLEGLRIVQLSDLHYSPLVWQRYLIQFIRWVNELEPDLVVITGDIITGGSAISGRPNDVLLPGLAVDVVPGGTSAVQSGDASRDLDATGTSPLALQRVGECQDAIDSLPKAAAVRAIAHHLAQLQVLPAAAKAGMWLFH